MISDFLRLARPFWVSDERGRAWATAALVAFLTLATVVVSVVLVQVGGAMFDAIQNYDLKAFLSALERWTLLAFIYCAMGVYQAYASMALTIRWRRWMTDDFLMRWLGDKTFYYWQIGGQPTDNPDQRITEDIRDFIGTNDGNSGAIPLVTGLLTQLATLFGFVGLLWKVGGALYLQHGRSAYHFHGYLVWGALLYSLIGSLLLAKLGRPIIALSFSQQRLEADFRFGLVRLREYGESIAMSEGEAVEHRGLMGMFASIRQNYLDIMNRVKKINAFTLGYGQAAVVMPYFMCAPVYFAHRMTLGGLNQSAQAFGSVQGAVSYFINVYVPIAQWSAVIRRLTGFTETMQVARSLSELAQAPNATPGRGAGVAVDGLSLSLPNGRPLIQDLNFSLEAGRTTLISGPSGSGKSTFFRAIAGMWPYAKGRIQAPAGFQPMMLPQKPYLPIGPLRVAIAYPQAVESYSEEAMRAALSAVRLRDLGDRLDESQNWAQMLSPGEQQRIALARVFLQRPSWLFLDEATSALDEATERAIYQGLADALPNATIVSVGHRSSLKPLHDTAIEFAPESVLPT